ncbi:serine/threonine protein kinase [Marinicella meishanensis]|uniref:serine/threonine protein kinase n=1 Tax=Marinicella meishanensis TaxID=2873263 RepID=UPI001CBDD680|nr:serine/threonine-protein kinase [Marinicella sp. NBU2979]
MDLTPADWQQVKTLFNELIELPAEQIPAALAARCAQHPHLKAALESMVETHLSSTDQTITPQQSAASTLLDQAGLKAGDRFARYQIIRAIGSGGMGQVYLAQRDDEVVQQVAIKVLNKHSLDAQGLARFDAERRILASLEHPNIARLIDAGTEGDQSYYVMEYVDGMPIDQYCQEHRLSLPERLRLFGQICQAVAFAHSNLIVHRDLKPGNILVTAQGEVKLLDFGIAKPLKTLPGTEQVHETLVGTTALTPQYAAPEQINGQGITVSCDVYVLGLLLFRLLTDQHAFELEGKTWGEIERVINEQLPTLPSRLLRRLPAPKPGWQHKLKGDLDAIVSHALKKEPEQRYLGVRELAADIDHYLNNEPLQIKQSQTAYRLKKQLRKHWLPVSALTAIFVVLAASSALIWNQSQTIAEERDKALVEKQVAEEVTTFLVDTFKSADPTETLGTQVTAGDILKQGVNQLQQQAPSPAVKNRLLTALAEVYLNLSSFDEAESLANQVSDTSHLNRRDAISLVQVRAQSMSERGHIKPALDLLESVVFQTAEKDRQYFRIMNLKINLIRGLDRFEEAKQMALDLKDEAEQLYGADSFFYAIQLRQYASRTRDFENRQPTINYYREVIGVLESLSPNPEPLELLKTKRMLMIELTGNLQYDEALALSAELEQDYLQVFEPNHVIFAKLYNSRGFAQMNSDRVEQSIDSFAKSREIYADKLGENSTNVAFTEINMAVNHLYELDNPQAAKELFELALAKFVNNSGKTNNYHYMNLPYATCLMKLNLWAEAKEAVMESLNYFLHRESKSELSIAFAHSLLAHVLVHEGDYLQAHELYSQSITRVIKNYGDTIHKLMIDQDVAIIAEQLGEAYRIEVPDFETLNQ